MDCLNKVQGQIWMCHTTVAAQLNTLSFSFPPPQPSSLLRTIFFSVCLLMFIVFQISLLLPVELGIFFSPFNSLIAIEKKTDEDLWIIITSAPIITMVRCTGLEKNPRLPSSLLSSMAEMKTKERGTLSRLG